MSNENVELIRRASDAYARGDLATTTGTGGSWPCAPAAIGRRPCASPASSSGVAVQNPAAEGVCVIERRGL
jgi:hypothetical protein